MKGDPPLVILKNSFLPIDEAFSSCILFPRCANNTLWLALCSCPSSMSTPTKQASWRSQALSEFTDDFWTSKRLYSAGISSALDFNAIRKQFRFLKAEYDKLFAEVKTLEIWTFYKEYRCSENETWIINRKNNVKITNCWNVMHCGLYLLNEWASMYSSFSQRLWGNFQDSWFWRNSLYNVLNS